MLCMENLWNCFSQPNMLLLMSNSASPKTTTPETKTSMQNHWKIIMNKSSSKMTCLERICFKALSPPISGQRMVVMWSQELGIVFCLENVIRFCWTWHCYWELGWVLQFNQPFSALATYGTWLLDAGWPKFSMRKSWFIATSPTSDANQMPISSGVVCENDPSILHNSPSTKKKRYIYNVVYRASCLSYLLSFFEWSSAKSALDQG